MDLLAAMQDLGHEQVTLHCEPDAGYRAVIALHSTVLGPAVGGTRLWQYASTEAAVLDALHLSRGMTYKAALAGLPLGGGKAVVLLPPAPGFDRRVLFRAHGRAVDALHGRFVTAEDVGTTPEDMDAIHAVTTHVAGLSHRSGNPAPSTARGVFRALQAAVLHRWGSERLEGRRILIQGCGQVGSDLARRLAATGATLLVTDTSAERARECARRYSATTVDPDRFDAIDVDVLAPCALGQVLDDRTIPRLRAAIVVGAANNQLAAPEHADLLARRGILYVPDYVANAGGLIVGTVELLDWSVEDARRRIDGIFDTVRALLELAEREGVTPARAPIGSPKPDSGATLPPPARAFLLDSTRDVLDREDTMTPAPLKPTIGLDVLNRIDVRVGTILGVAEVPNADRLVQLRVSFGDHERTIVAGLRQERADPGEIEGRQALFVVNLEPRQLKGVRSEGMLFDIGFADGITPVLAVPEAPVPDGARAG